MIQGSQYVQASRPLPHGQQERKDAGGVPPLELSHTSDGSLQQEAGG